MDEYIRMCNLAEMYEERGEYEKVAKLEEMLKELSKELKKGR